MMRLNITLGIDDFRRLREEGFEYVDKTHLITELIDNRGIIVALLPRPRRFGKTINLTMLRWFFEKRDENVWHLFEGLHIDRAGDAYKAYFQQHPVIHLSFKGTRADDFEVCRGKIIGALQSMYKAHEAVLEGHLRERDLAKFRAVLEGTADEVSYQTSLAHLTEYLHQVHGKRPIVLIDEYDAPIHAGYAHGYYDKIVGFFRSFFESGLKDNPHLERAVLTGILRVSRESIFSGLNNAVVYTLLDQQFNTCFGFTDAEVSTLLSRAGIPEQMDAVRSFYNGYDFGGEAIYNPWSILNFLAAPTPRVQPFWANTSSNDLVKELLQHHAFAVESDIRTLLEGGSIKEHINTNVVFPELRENVSALWSLLVFTGYLKATRAPVGPGEDFAAYWLSLPNTEVVGVYRTTFQAWMNKGLRPQGGELKELLAALLDGNACKFEQHLQKFAGYLPSYHDVEGVEPEKFYQGMMIGLLAGLEPEYEVRSNRESGTGRPDVLIKPRRPGKPGVVLELKAAGKRAGRTMRQALKEGLDQLRGNDYAAELRAAGVEKVHQMAIAFDGKNVRVELALEPAKKKTALRKVGESIRKAAKKVRPKRG